jgi:hypothetical protein
MDNNVKTVRFIGDVHAKFDRYKKLIRNVTTSVQVGDFGVGFYQGEGRGLTRPPYDHMAKGDHRFIRGNHDNPEQCRTHPFWIPDGSVIHDKIFCVGGAYSIDQHRRTQGLDWWPDEELTYAQFQSVFDAYEAAKPEIVVAHEMPEHVAHYVCNKLGISKLNIPSVTRQALEAMVEFHKPRVFIHGHWHFDHVTEFRGVKYIGLGELSHLDMQI